MSDWWTADAVVGKPAVGGEQWWAQDQPVSAVSDTIKSLGSGVVKGGAGLVGLLSDASELGARGINAATQVIGKKLGVDVGPSREPVQQPTLGQADILRRLQGVTGKLHEPQTTAGHYAQTVGEFVPGAIMGPGGIAAKLTRFAIAPGLASEAAGQASKGSEFEPWARTGAALGASVINPSRLLTPFPSTSGHQALVKALKDEGITGLQPGDISGNRKLQWFESVLKDTPMAGMGARDADALKSTQLAQAVLGKMGGKAAQGETLIPEVIDRTVSAVGQKFNDLAARNTLTFDSQMFKDLTKATDDYRRLAGKNAPAGAVETHLKDILSSASQGTMPGVRYQALRSQLGTDAEALKGTPTGMALKDIQKSLDHAMTRSISPQDAMEWAGARTQWKNWLAVQKANISGEGYISPVSLRNAVQAQGRSQYKRGKGDMAELARAAEEVLRPLPNSGTSAREQMNHFLDKIGTIGGALGGGVLGAAGAGGPVETGILGSIVGGPIAEGMKAVAMPAAGRAYNNPLIQSYLANQRFGFGTPPGVQRKLLAAQLMAQPGQPPQ